jgi:hypothetical protein
MNMRPVGGWRHVAAFLLHYEWFGLMDRNFVVENGGKKEVPLNGKPPVAPPVYRPERPRIAQAKTASSSSSPAQLAKLNAVARSLPAKPPSDRFGALVI